MPVLAHDHVRLQVERLCREARETAERVVRSAHDGEVDPEAIHDHRVALRKLRTLLAASAPLFRRRPLARVRAGLRELAHAAGAVRDEEVLAETLGELDLPPASDGRVDAWLRNRARRARRLRAAFVERLASPEHPHRAPPPSLERPVLAHPIPPEGPAEPAGERPVPDCQAPPEGPVAAEAPAQPIGGASPPSAPGEPGEGNGEAAELGMLLAQAEALPLRRRAAGVSTRALALSALREAGRKVCAEAARPDAESPEARHRLRIRWKRVRYTAELFEGALAGEKPTAEALARLIKVATRMQKRLGGLHDVDAAIARVARARALSPGDRMVVHHRLRREREALSQRLAKDLPPALALVDGGGRGRDERPGRER